MVERPPYFITFIFMWLFWVLFEAVTTPLAIVADIVTMGKAGEEKSFTREKMEAIDKELKK